MHELYLFNPSHDVNLYNTLRFQHEKWIITKSLLIILRINYTCSFLKH